MKYLSIIAVFFLFSFHSSLCRCQEYDMVAKLKMREDITLLEKRISYLIMKDPLLAEKKGIKQVHIFWLCYDGHFSKEDYLDHSFLDRLRPMYLRKRIGGLFTKRRYLKAETVLCDSVGNVFAWAKPNFIALTSNFSKSKIEIAKMIYSEELDFVFKVSSSVDPHSISISYGVKGDAVYVFDSTAEGVLTYTLDEFIECCYKDWESIF